MADTIFAIPRTPYDSYADLYTLIGLSGYPTCYIDEIDAQSDNTYIVTILNGEVTGWPDAKARIILWDLEYHLDGIPDLAGIAEVWASDKWYAGVINARYVPMGSHAGLCPERTPKQDAYDVAYLAYLVPRRQRIQHDLTAAGVRVSPSSAWGSARHTLLRNSAAYLHVHQHDNAPTIAPLRLVVAAAYALPFITETVADIGIFRQLILQADYGHIVQAASVWTRQSWEKDLLPHALALHQKLCHDLTFRKSIEAAL